MNTLLYSDICNIAALNKPPKKKLRTHTVQDEYVLFVNNSSVSVALACALMRSAVSIDTRKVHVICSDSAAKAELDAFIAMDCGIRPKEAYLARIAFYDDVDAFLKEPPKYTYSSLYFGTFLDASAPAFTEQATQAEYLSVFQRILTYILTLPNARLVHTTHLPALQPLPEGMVSLSEREYEVYAAQTATGSPERFVADTEELLRSFVKRGLCAIATRQCNVFGPGIASPVIDPLLQAVKTDRVVTLDTAKRQQYFGMNYITFAAYFAYQLYTKGQVGNLYHFQQYQVTPYDLALQFYMALEDDRVTLQVHQSGTAGTTYALLCNRKNGSIPRNQQVNQPLHTSLTNIILADPDMAKTDDLELSPFTYDGKLNMIKSIEIEIMEEIKRICEKHNIKYFLVGGSLLGAVRHKGFIPWDDDLDVGMLREDFERFKAVAPQELDPRYMYQNHTTDPNSNYIFDKIRLRDTFFSTAFSNMFQMENGLFIDILVYDKTAKKPKAQKKHIWLLQKLTRLTNIRWVNRYRPKVDPRYTRILMPFIRLFPAAWYLKIFEKVLTRYNRTDSPWAIDGVGQNIGRGAFPIAWFDETIEVPFENTTFPIPKAYDEYLRHWYGENYMAIPPASMRNSGHAIRRLDLGAYVTRFGWKEGNYHHASLKGELYDALDNEQ